MPLTAGVHLGPYEILAAIGEGGMGEVYRARDSKLGRDVAIKILPASVANDPERLARFEREAQDPGVPQPPAHRSDLRIREPTRIVMELVDGGTLADRIGRERLPIAEALEIARQIAEGAGRGARERHRSPRFEAGQHRGSRGTAW